MDNAYRKALVYISHNPGTSSALGLAKLILSLYNRTHPFGLAECTFGFDEARTKLAEDMVLDFLRRGETDELLEVGPIVRTSYPDLVQQAEFVREAREMRRSQEILRKFGGMTASQLDRLDEYAQRLIDDPQDGGYGVLSTGERMYVLLAASRADLLAEYDDTVPEALSRLGDADVEQLTSRWKHRHYKPYRPQGR